MWCLLWHRPGDHSPQDFRPPVESASKQTRVAQTAFSLQKAWKIQQSSLMVIAWIGLFKHVNAIGQHQSHYRQDTVRCTLVRSKEQIYSAQCGGFSVREIYVEILNLNSRSSGWQEDRSSSFWGWILNENSRRRYQDKGIKVIVTKYEYKWCHL